MLTWELVGAVIGAGFASGKEIASFFSQYGSWSIAGITAAVLTMICLSNGAAPSEWKNKLFAQVWRWLLASLLIATGGVMLSGAGEVVSLVLPIHGAYWIGCGWTLVLSWFLANRTVGGLVWISKLLLVVLTLLILLGFTVEPMRGVRIESENYPVALLRGMTYGGFNAALQSPILFSADRSGTQAIRQRPIIIAGIMTGILLMLGNAVLLRHPALMAEPMPFIRLMQNYGRIGYCLGSTSLYLAILSTLTACLRGIGGSCLCTAWIVLISLLGFTGMVEKVYPLLGGACFLMLAVSKFTNSSGKPFNSRQDML